MLASIALATLLQVPEPYVQDWQTMLRRVVAAEGIALCVDVDPSRKPGALQYEKASGMPGLDRLCAATQRTMTLVDGVYVLRRRPEEGDLRFMSPHQHAMAFLTSLGAIDTMKLCDGKLELSNVAPTFQRRLRYAIGMLGKGLGDSMLANYPDRIGMRLLYEPIATVDSRTGNGMVSLNLTGQNPDVPYPPARRESAVTPLSHPFEGEIDFEGGAVYFVSEIVERAQRTFHHRFLYDERLAASRVFISGLFTEERLRKTLDAVLEPFPVVPAPESFENQDFAVEARQVINLAFGLMGNEKVGIADITYNNMIVGRTTSFKDLFGTRFPRPVQQFMSEYRIQPEDVVSISGDLYLAFAAPGLATLESGSRDALGNPVPYSVPHFLKIGF